MLLTLPARSTDAWQTDFGKFTSVKAQIAVLKELVPAFGSAAKLKGGKKGRKAARTVTKVVRDMSDEEYARQVDNLLNNRQSTLGPDQRADVFNACAIRIGSRELELQEAGNASLEKIAVAAVEHNSLLRSAPFMRAAATGNIPGFDIALNSGRAQAQARPAVAEMFRDELVEADHEGVEREEAFKERRDEFDSDV